jgi:superfamily II DNA or RNA helicase
VPGSRAPSSPPPQCRATVYPADVVRARIAQALLGTPNGIAPRIGRIVLQRHQVDGVRRLGEIFSRHHGALLADEVGLGKTYTALAATRGFQRVLIVAPAALRAMWHEACARCEVAADFVSAESLSRCAALEESAADIVVVDEAHWFRNRATRRYQQLARRCRRATVLLLSATPLHNRASDLAALCGLFMGRRAERLTPHDVAQLTLRRGRDRVAMDQARPPPRVGATHWWRVRVDPRVVAALVAIEPPVPLRDGALAMGLLRLTLLRRFSSSAAALRATLRGMLARAFALLEAARGGRYPNARELRAWLVVDDSIQLAFPSFVAAATAKPNEPLSTTQIERHMASIRTALAALDLARDRDRERASALRRLMQRFPRSRIVAFSQYDASVRALARALRREHGIAVLSAKGGRIASGRIVRDEVLRQFDAGRISTDVVHPAMQIRLLLTTDMLSEGVNLHNADVLVHLDLPWTPARLEQRVGRLSRLGSPHEAIHVFGFAPPAALERMQRTVARLRAKWMAARLRFGVSPLLARDSLFAPGRPRRSRPAGAHALDHEALLLVLAQWLGDSSPSNGATDPLPLVAWVRVDLRCAPFVLALLRVPSGALLVTWRGAGAVSSRPRSLLTAAQTLWRAPDTEPDSQLLTHAIARLERYLARMRGEVAATTLGKGAHGAAFQAQVAHAAAALPRSVRPHALRLAAAIHVSLQEARSAGDDALLRERCAVLVATAKDTEPLLWLERAESDLAQRFDPSAGAPRLPAAETWRVDAVLIGT